MITDLDRHVVDRFLAAPASRLAIVLSQVVRAGITAMIQTLILLLVGLALGVRVHGGFAGWIVVFAASRSSRWSSPASRTASRCSSAARRR